MPSEIEHRSTSTYPAGKVYAAMVDRAYLDARLARIGGRDAGVLEYRADADGARYRLRHGLDADAMPSMVRSLLPGDIAIERTESWTRVDASRYDGEAQVDVQGTPASGVGGMRLRDDEAGGSLLVVRSAFTVDVPFIGGRIEQIIGQQVRNLLAAEAEFTQAWLDQHR